MLKVATTPAVTLESVSEHLLSQIQGNESTFDDATFRKLADLERIKKVYKLGTSTPASRPRKAFNGNRTAANDREDVDETKDLEVQILGLIALRGAT